MNAPEGIKATNTDPISRTINSVLAAMSDNFALFILIATVENNSEVGIESNITKPKSRHSYINPSCGISVLMEAGLVVQSQGKLSLTPLGKEIYKHTRTLTVACNLFPKLQIIDTVSSMNSLPSRELIRIIDSVLEDSNIRQVLKEHLDLSR
jgi:hypothetical protein